MTALVIAAIVVLLVAAIAAPYVERWLDARQAKDAFPAVKFEDDEP